MALISTLRKAPTFQCSKKHIQCRKKLLSLSQWYAFSLMSTYMRYSLSIKRLRTMLRYWTRFFNAFHTSTSTSLGVTHFCWIADSGMWQDLSGQEASEFSIQCSSKEDIVNSPQCKLMSHEGLFLWNIKKQRNNFIFFLTGLQNVVGLLRLFLVA